MWCGLAITDVKLQKDQADGNEPGADPLVDGMYCVLRDEEESCDGDPTCEASEDPQSGVPRGAVVYVRQNQDAGSFYGAYDVRTPPGTRPIPPPTGGACRKGCECG